ncbi:MAG: 50S ribosomal protein L6 [Microscillaceae bacterium]
MSRVGKKPINIPAGVTIELNDQSICTVKGPKGTLSQYINPAIEMKIEGSEITFTRPSDDKDVKSMHGLYRALVNNMIQGVTEGFSKKLEVVGVGFKASNNGNVLELSLGYSHGIFFALPPELKLTTETEKGKSPVITIEGIDKQLLGQVVAKIKSLRKVEPYKGKGIREFGETVRRKAGKTASKK